MSMENLVKLYKQRDLDGGEIEALVGKPPVLYADLKKYKNVKQLLGKEGRVVILYETSSRTNGHFVALYERYDGVLCFSDSYGLRYDTEQQYAEYTNKLPRYLTALIENSGMPVDYNKVDYQSKNSKIADCGRYSSFFCLIGQKANFREIQTLLTTNQDAFLIPDNIITLITLIGLHNIRHFFERENKTYTGRFNV